MHRRLCLIVVTLVAVATMVAPASAGLVFFDDFSSDPLGVPAGALVNWTIDRASVDVVGTGSYPELCAGGPSDARCVDLDGTFASTAGKISHTEALLGTGSYLVSFYLRGNARNAGPDTVVFSFGSYSESFTLLGSSPWTQYVRAIDYVGPVGLTIAFDHLGASDQQGILLDDVRIDAVPEPGTLLLLGSGISALALRRRRKS